MQDKELLIFDLDGTLAESKSQLTQEMAAVLVRLLLKKKVVVVSGGAFKQFEKQFLSALPPVDTNLKNLVLMPASGGIMYSWNNSSWKEEYAKKFTKQEKEKIINALEAAIDEAEVEAPDVVYGPPLIEDRETQITFSDFGQEAPLEVKSGWDPDHKKRERIVKFLQEKIPEFSVNIGGTTSIDITQHGIDKAYAIRRALDHFKVPIEKTVFIGDAIFPGGNDYPAVSTGVDTIQVSGPEEAERLMRTWSE